MLLVTGPTGNVGDELVEMFAATDPGPWRVAGRHADALRNRLTDSAADVVRFDFFDRRTWSAALENIERMFLLFPLPGNRAAREVIVPFIETAAAAGCRHAVYISVIGADRAAFIPHHTVEAALRRHFPSWTVLRCSFFMQNLHRAISSHGVDITERGGLFIPAGNGATTFLDARDAARVAALVLRRPEVHRDAVYQLTGGQRLTMTEVAAALSTALGYPVRYTDPNLIQFARRLRQRKLGWDTIGFMSAVYTLTRFGRNQQLTDDVRDLLGRPPRTLDQFLQDSAWRWHQRAWT